MRAAEELVKSIPGAEIAATYSIFEILNLRGAQKLGQKHVSAVKIETLKPQEEKRNVKQKQFQMTKVAPAKEPVRKLIQSERHSSMGTRRHDSPPPKPKVNADLPAERPPPPVEKKKAEPAKRFDATEFRIKR